LPIGRQFGNNHTKVRSERGKGHEDTDPAEVTKFAVDGWNYAKPEPIGNENYDVWADLDAGGSLTTRYLRGDVVDELFARVDTGSDAFWFLNDHLGSIRDIISNDGLIQDGVEYDAFGNITEDSAYRGRYGWTGREFDVETGLQYNRARYYDATIGRWIGQDPIGFDAGDSNLYRYVNNEPRPDPSGMADVAAVEIGRVKYYPNAGWIDMGHAADDLPRIIINKIKGGQNNFSTFYTLGRYRLPPLTAVQKKNYYTISVNINWGNSRFYAPVEFYLVNKSVTAKADIHSVALAIYMHYSQSFETEQLSPALTWKSPWSGFSREDLPSDLLAFHLHVNDMDIERDIEILETAKFLGTPLSIKEARGMMIKLGGDLGIPKNKNTTFTPKNDHALSSTLKGTPLNWLNGFSPIVPAASGAKWLHLAADFIINDLPPGI